MKTILTTLIAAGTILCSEPVAAEPTGKDLFEEKCAMCHRERGMGTLHLMRRYPPELAVLENRESLPPEFVEAVVRNGLGIMFSISRAEVSDDQLDKITGYLSNPDKGEADD